MQANLNESVKTHCNSSKKLTEREKHCKRACSESGLRKKNPLLHGGSQTCVSSAPVLTLSQLKLHPRPPFSLNEPLLSSLVPYSLFSSNEPLLSSLVPYPLFSSNEPLSSLVPYPLFSSNEPLLSSLVHIPSFLQMSLSHLHWYLSPLFFK